MSVLVFDMMDGKECVRSTQGDMRTAPAGRGRPMSRKVTRRQRARLPPSGVAGEDQLFGGDGCMGSAWRWVNQVEIYEIFVSLCFFSGR